jgi:hypothetical protein
MRAASQSGPGSEKIKTRWIQTGVLQPRRPPSSLLYLIGHYKLVLGSLLHYKSKNEIEKWQGDPTL